MSRQPKSSAQMLNLEAELARRGIHWAQGPFSSYEGDHGMVDPMADVDWRDFLSFLHGWMRADD